MSGDITRREVLAGVGSLGALGALAGCSGQGDGGGGDGDAPTATPSPTPTGTPTPTRFAPDCSSPTTLNPDEYTDGGTVSRGCYRVEDTITVESGTLEIESGVWLRFAKDVGMQIAGEGALRVSGTAVAPVVLTGTTQTRGHWAGLRFRDSETDADVLEHVVVEYAGGDNWHGGSLSRGGLFVQNQAAVTVRNATFRENGQAAIVSPSRKATVTVSNSAFEANAAPIWVHANTVGGIASNNTFDGNDAGHIAVGLSGARDRVDTEQTWTDPGIPYEFRHTATLRAPVTITDGTKLRFRTEAGLDVKSEASLSVQGAVTDFVIFTGTADSRGAWTGIRFHDTPSGDNLLENAIVEYAGGQGGWHGGSVDESGVFLNGGQTSLTVKKSTFRHNRRSGLTANAGGTDLTLEGNNFNSNARPLRLHPNLVGDVAADNAFDENDENFVFVGFGAAGKSVSETATWPALGVPYRPTEGVVVQAPMTVAPGARFAFEQDVGLKVQGDGRLAADASGGEQIVFSGVENITGYWAGVSFQNSLSRDNVMRNVVVEYGGGDNWHGGGSSVANVFLYDGDSAGGVVLEGSTIRGSGKYGISIGNDSRLMGCGKMVFENNQAPATYNYDTEEPIDACYG